ncbi:lysine biosynthesis enzyme LysX [Candidatus Gottesmanbacteria bacterium RBG_16_37_8]|uniref:Lysine biosynthesis enzyme LysX n=1 Tax=Candidatus Gottesmanbacteria bacterium RBG_16_37_8 TaxID=1798371 RepID=A0A1F5YRG8_9BACT|nr:MAG: lysine biosynthesis enzyme LysX [Candidatus Gottesmanbacteria bacterium RBG_16_37_8]
MKLKTGLKLALLHSTIREDEKLIIREAEKNHLDLTILDARYQVFNPHSWQNYFDVILERCLSTTVGFQATLFFERLGMKVINSSIVANNCDNKFLTSLLLSEHKIPTIPFALVFNEDQAKQAVKQLGGYPLVIKPVSGSWGRLLAKVNDDDSLEGIIEQKQVLGSPMQKALYLQKYVNKPGRDIRVVVIANQVVCAIYRETSHWITNTARGAQAKNCKVDQKLSEICVKASSAVGGGILGIDIFETDKRFLVNEINHTMEYKNVQRVTGVNVAAEIIHFCQEVAKS